MKDNYELLKAMRELETEGTTADASRGFKWMCLLLVWFVAAICGALLLIWSVWG